MLLEIEDRIQPVLPLEEFAHLEARTGQACRSARLRAHSEQLRKAARNAHANDQSFEIHWSEGSKLTLRQAVEPALSTPAT